MVTGPSLVSSTAIWLRNRPVFTSHVDMPRSREVRSSKIRLAISGGAARVKLGLLPCRTSPKSVNWETRSISPPMSRIARFILPVESSKTRRPASFEARYAISPCESSSETPTKTQKPGPMLEMSSLPTETLAHLTRCTTARIVLTVTISRKDR